MRYAAHLAVDFDLHLPALETRKTHTALTSLGVAIGVASIVTVVALRRGAQNQLTT